MLKIRFLALQFLLLAPLFACAQNTLQEHQEFVIVWDVGHVLVGVNKGSMVWNDLGIRYILKTVYYRITPTKMRTWMYEALQQYGGHQPSSTPGNAPVDDEKGVILPLFVADTWLCSRIPNDKILEHIHRAVDQWAPSEQISAEERDLVRQTLLAAMSATVLGKNTTCIPAALTLVKAFAAQGIPQYILSNFEDEAFQEMLKNPCNQELFSLIPLENRTVSGVCKLTKPHHTIFKYFEEQHNLQGKKIIFIDDQLKNIEAARECGWHAIHLQNGNYTQLAHDLNTITTSLSHLAATA